MAECIKHTPYIGDEEWKDGKLILTQWFCSSCFEVLETRKSG